MQNWSTTTSFQNGSRDAQTAVGAEVRAETVSVVYDDGERIEAARDVSFELEPGASCALIGPSGCGKSTLLYVLAGLKTPTRGKVMINGVPVTAPRRDTALILQDYGLLAWKSLYDNVALGLQIRGVRKSCRDELVVMWLEKLGSRAAQRRTTTENSGGPESRSRS